MDGGALSRGADSAASVDRAGAVVLQLWPLGAGRLGRLHAGGAAPRARPRNAGRTLSVESGGDRPARLRRRVLVLGRGDAVAAVGDRVGRRARAGGAVRRDAFAADAGPVAA